MPRPKFNDPRCTDLVYDPAEVCALLDCLERVTASASLLAAELHDRGTEALAAIHCAQAELRKFGK